MMADFLECKQCKEKPGSPDLCAACVQNRKTINELTSRIVQLELMLDGVENDLIFEREHSRRIIADLLAVMQ